MEYKFPIPAPAPLPQAPSSAPASTQGNNNFNLNSPPYYYTSPVPPLLPTLSSLGLTEGHSRGFAPAFGNTPISHVHGPFQLTFHNTSSFLFSRDTNSSFVCPALNLHYQTSYRREGILHTRIQFYKIDPQTRAQTLFAEWDRRGFGKATLQIGSRTGKEEEVFPQTKGLRSGLRFERTFVANNGRTYIWQSKVRGPLSLLCNDNPSVPIATFHPRRPLFGPSESYLQLESGWEEILDFLIVTCVITHQQRVENGRQVALSAAGT